MLAAAGILATACLGVVSAHMQLTFPLPLESSFDPLNKNPDYSMTSPLAQDGSNFPCKGYLGVADAHVTASFSAGQMANFTLTGSATHGGGSCQVSLSYDGGKTFKVINTILGGCPLQSAYNFQFPAGLPAGNNVVFSWSWFNKVGNREMYQNCAMVNIVGSGSQSFLSTLPDMQVANVGNGCTSIESIEVIPENPGASVQYGGTYAAGAAVVSGLNGAGLTGTCGSANSAIPAVVSSSTIKSIASPTKVSISTSTMILPSSSSTALARAGFAKITSSAAAAMTTTSNKASATSSSSVSQGCTNGAIICTGTGYTWSLCSNGIAVAMGAVAPGTICKNAQMQIDSGVASSVVAGNVAAKGTSASATVKTSPVTLAPAKTTVLPTTTSACLNKREARDACEIFSVQCSSEKQYRLCEGDRWSEKRDLPEAGLCLDNELYNTVAKMTSTPQVSFQKSTICTGTGITCSENGLHYYICDQESEMPAPAGTRCLESNSGGGFVSWHDL